MSPLARARSTSRRASAVEIPSAAATSVVPKPWASDMMSRASKVGSSSRRNRSISANLVVCAGDFGPSATACTRNGSPAVQCSRCSATGSGPSDMRGRSRSMATISSPRCSWGSAATTTVAWGSATRSMSPSSSASVSRWASSTTNAASGGSSVRGGRASTVRPARVSPSRAAARTVVLPVPTPPLIKSLAGTVAALARAEMADAAGWDTGASRTLREPRSQPQGWPAIPVTLAFP